MAESSIGGAVEYRSAQSAFVLCAVTLVSGVFFQKIALPGTGGIYPLNLLIFPAVAAAAFVAGVLEVNTAAFIWYALFALVGSVGAALSSSSHVSVLSLGFLVVAQFPLVFRYVQTDGCYRRVVKFLSTLGCISALIGVLQFVGQFVVGVDAAFFLDTRLPASVTVSGYNSLIPLYWSSPVYKSNGVFFLEPSFFCQFLAIAMVAELLLRPRGLRLLILTAGLLCSYSGTGLTMLALFLPFYFFHHGHSRLVIFVTFIGIALIFFGDVLRIDTFTRRLAEFSDVQSSGSARFLSMFTVLQRVVFANDLTFFLGRGPGTVQEQFRLFSFYAFDPTWGKVIYEYGLLGSLVYFRFFYLAFCDGPKGLRFATGYTYLFLGGYLLNASVLMQLAALVAWHGRADAATQRQGEGATGGTSGGLRAVCSDVPALGTR